MTSRSASTRASSGSWVTSSGGAVDGRPGGGAARPGCPAGSGRPARRAARRAAAAPASTARARASATRWACPPESCRGWRRAMLGQPDPVQPLRRPSRRACGPGRAVAARPEGDVVQRGQVREEQVVLEDDADRPPVRRDEGAGVRIVQHGRRRARRARRSAAPARPAPAARWSCRRRSGRAARPPRRPRPSDRDVEPEAAAVAPPMRVESTTSPELTPQRHPAVAQRRPGS